MVDVVAIHGIGMHRASRGAMSQSWHEALVEGLSNIRSRHAGSLTLECAFYGHEYNDGKAGAGPQYSSADVEPGFETELLTAIADAVSDEESDAGSAAETKAYLPRTVQRSLVRIERSGLFEGRDGLLISFVKQVRRYLTDDELRGRVNDEVATAMERLPRVVIGHSLGSVIAYEWLRAHQLDDPPHLLTIGSPLGLAAIRRRLAPADRRPGWPGGVPVWTNVAARQDAVAMVKCLAPLIDSRIHDLSCDNPRRTAHAATSYLMNLRTARALDKSLG
ncbi:hypothetical protein [Blastococcus sp. SYSU DS0616]